MRDLSCAAMGWRVMVVCSELITVMKNPISILNIVCALQNVGRSQFKATGALDQQIFLLELKLESELSRTHARGRN